VVGALDLRIGGNDLEEGGTTEVPTAEFVEVLVEKVVGIDGGSEVVGIGGRESDDVGFCVERITDGPGAEPEGPLPEASRNNARSSGKTLTLSE
jgi:hypothetical protein